MNNASPIFKQTSLMDARKLSQTWSVFSESTIRELAALGNLPVAGWVNGEPIFSYDAEMADAFIRLFHGPYKVRP